MMLDEVWIRSNIQPNIIQHFLSSHVGIGSVGWAHARAQATLFSLSTMGTRCLLDVMSDDVGSVWPPPFNNTSSNHLTGDEKVVGSSPAWELRYFSE